MITIEMLCVRLQRVSAAELEGWIERAWIRPEGAPGHYLFEPIDEARARLILELRDDLHINEEALPVVLSLLDQVYAARRHMRRVRDAIEAHADNGLAEQLRQLLQEEQR
ncbi:chaperone modulator CbpM [Lichenicola sp.]|uniref:chaperone modulator CbpM n=1 Tax=Lichenicola sp. TaxID=2804529 RepID=UPI003B0011CD